MKEEGNTRDPKPTTSSVKYGGGNVIGLACMAASAIRSLVFIDYVPADTSTAAG